MGKKHEQDRQYAFELPPPVQLAPAKSHERNVDDLPEIKIPEGSAWQLVRDYWTEANRLCVDPRLIKYAQDHYQDWENFIEFFQSTGSISEADRCMGLDES